MGSGLILLEALGSSTRAETSTRSGAQPRGPSTGANVLFAVGTLEYLARSGRIGGRSAWSGRRSTSGPF